MTSSYAVFEDGTLIRTAAFGVGRVRTTCDGMAVVRYFRGPSRSPFIDHEHPLAELAPTDLRAHTRVYVYDGRRWRIGRIDGPHPQDHNSYLVAFPNQEGGVLPVEAFDVRWDLPVDNPYEVLESVGGDSPLVYGARLAVLGEWTHQRAAAMGAEGLLLGSVELHRHQLAVVRRVAADPVKRYLLADEVGLGKTVEASALIWQFLSSHPTGSVVVLVPEHLRQQWALELVERFRTDRFPGAHLKIRSHSDIASWPTDGVDLLVIDEAHHVTRAGSLSVETRRGIAQIAHAAEGLLLLSATPVRSNEAGFLDLLYLLDPDRYHPDQLDQFVRLVELRDRLALTCQALVPDIDAFDLLLYVDELTSVFPDDHLLASLLTEAAAADDATRPSAVSRVRQHLSETYRLHHRLLRTRRTEQVSRDFQVRGRKRAVPFITAVPDDSDTLRAELLDDLRLHLAATVEAGDLDSHGAVEVFAEVAQRCGSLSHALAPLVGRGSSESTPGLRSFRELTRREILPDFTPSITAIHAHHAAVLEALVDAVSSFTISRRYTRTVVATAFTETAVAVANELYRRWGADRSAAHLTTNSHQANTDAIARWAGNGPCSVLVLDSSAEEGVNLQDADLLIHLDLPWESFRVEQRIGRCDRHADPNPGPIPSMVIIFGDQPYAMGWLEFLTDGCAAFSRSLSSLQYVLNDTERDVQRSVLRDGPDALSNAASGQAERLGEELVRIIAHDALDAVDVTPSHDGPSADEQLISSDARPVLTRALVTWLEGVGAGITWDAPDVLRVARRPHPQVPFDLELAMAPSMDTPLTMGRRQAVTGRLPILRAGHPMLDAIATHLQHNDRGVAFAMFRESPGQWPPAVALRSDVLISTELSEDLAEEADAKGLREWLDQMLQELAPPVVETIWATPDGHDTVEMQLRRPYEPRRGDRNLASRPELFEKLTSDLDWRTVCATAASNAQQLLDLRSSIKDRPRSTAALLREQIMRRLDRAKARENAGLDDADVDLRSLVAAVPELATTRIMTLGCGAVFAADASRLGIR